MARKRVCALLIALLAACLCSEVLSQGGLRIAGSGGAVGELAIPIILANATAVLTPKYGQFDVSYQSVDSPQDVKNVLSGADDFALSYIPLTAQAYKSAGRVLLQIPWAISNMAMIINVPGVGTGQLRLNAKLLGSIYQCSITNWNDPAIAMINPGITLPDLKIVPGAFSSNKATTQIFTAYLATAPGWKLGVGIQLPWTRCVQHVLTPDNMLEAVSKAPGAISYIGAWRVNASAPVPTAVLQNAAGNYLGPTARFGIDSLKLPSSVASPDWAGVDFSGSTQPDIYPMTGFLYNIVNQDVSAAGLQQAEAIRDLMAYFLSDAVQSNLTTLDLAPIPPARRALFRAEVAQMIVRPTNGSTQGAATALAPNVLDGLVTMGTVVEGSGGASIQNLIYRTISDGSAANKFGAATINYAPTDSIQGKAGVVSNSFAYGISTIALTADEIAAAGRPLVQVPVGFSPIAIVHTVPGVKDGVLRLTPNIVARIFQCTLTNWNDPEIRAVNPSVTLPDVPIAPFGLADVSGTTELMSVYAARSQNWTLGVSTSLAWPRCVRRTSGGSNAVLQSVNGTANAIGYVSYNALVAVGPQLPVASVINKAGVYVAPNASVFPFYKEELPDNISSPKWNALSLNDTFRTDKYPIGSLIYIIADQDLSAVGYLQALTVQQLIQYFLSDTVQANLQSQGASPMIATYLPQERQQVAALRVESESPGAPGTPKGGVARAQAGSSRAGFPWWAGLIVALAAVAILGAAALAACLVIRRRRRRRTSEGASLVAAGARLKDEEVGAKKEVFRFDRGSDDPPDRGNRAHDARSTPPSGRLNRTPSVDSDHLIVAGGDPVLDQQGIASAAGSLEPLTGGGSSSSHSGHRSVRSVPTGDHRIALTECRSTSLPQQNGTANSDVQSMPSSRGQSLQNEPAMQSLPGLIRARANSIDIDEVERGTLLGRGSFGKVYQGWWRGGSVAIKIVPHEGELGEKVDALRESLLCSAIQHPHIVTTYKVITLHKGAAQQRLRQQEASIPEGVVSSPEGSAGTGTSQSSPGMNLMETWIIMEYCDLGSLDSAISDCRFQDLESMLLRLLDVALGMDYLHNLGILHTDLKPSNVLLKTTAKTQNDTTGCTAKLADFGLSRVLETNATHISTNTIGTIAYQPEEVLRDGHVTPASDVYSFAILMYEMYTRKHLFKGMMHSQMFFKVFNGYRPPIPLGMPKGFQDLMTAAWSHNPSERPSYRSIVKALQRLIREHRRAMGRATSVNLDDVLPMEPAMLFPVGPAMPIRVPSGPPPPETSSADSSRAREMSGASVLSAHAAQSPGTPDDFERALQDLRAKAAAGRLAPAAPSATAPAPAAAAAPGHNGGISAFAAAAAGSPRHSSNGSGGSGNRGSGNRGSGNGGHGTPGLPPMSVSAANAQQPRPMSRGKNYDLLLGD